MDTYFIRTFVLCISLFTSQSFASTKTLFEAYYKINLHGQHVGYYIQKYELETTKKEFISTYFLRTNQAGGNISESLKAYASEKLNPIKYQYTSLQAQSAKTIDANVRKDKKGREVLQIKTNENGKLRVSEQKLEDGTFFSTFLIYLLLQGEKKDQPGVKGIHVGAKYNFKAIAEEDGKSFPGEVYVESEQQKMGLKTFKVLYTFKKTQFVNFINGLGESILSISPALGLEAELVKNSAEAIGNITFNAKSVSLLFGEVPQGTKNEVVQKANLSNNSQESQKINTEALKKETKQEGK